MRTQCRWFGGLLAMMLVCLTTPSFAEDAPQTPALTLQDCIAIAQQQQVDVLLGQKSLDVAKARSVQAKSNYYPQVSAKTSTDLAVTAFGRDGNGHDSNTALTVTQNFYDGGLREANVRSAKATVAQNAGTLERTRQTVVYSVTRDYFSLLRARQLAEVNDAKVKYLEGQRDLVRTRVQLGDAAEVDALPIEAELANAQVDQLAAKNSVRTAAIQLQNAMGLSPQESFTVQAFAEPKEYLIDKLDAYLQIAQTARPEIESNRQSVIAAKSTVQSAKIQMRPRPVVSGQFDQPLMTDSKNAFTLSAGIVFDLFNGGKNKAAYEEAQASQASAELRAAQLAKDIESDVQTAYLNLQSAKERLAASELSQRSAQRNFEAQDSRYKQGLAIPLDLLNAQVSVVTAQSNAVNAKYDYYTALAQLEYAIGKQGGLYGN